MPTGRNLALAISAMTLWILSECIDNQPSSLPLPWTPYSLLDVANLRLELLQLLLDVGVLLGHLLVLGLPLVPLGLESLDFPLEVSCLDVGLSKPV